MTAAAHDDVHRKAVMMRALSVMDGVGKGNVKHSIAQRMALVELKVLDVREGVLSPPVFLQHPAHLPEGKELQLLVNSATPRDLQLRKDAHAWVAMNKDAAEKAAVGLHHAIAAIREADDLLNDPDTPEEVHGWMTEINDYLKVTFGVDPATAPHGDRELRDWANAMCQRANPCPKWLREWRPGSTGGGARSLAEDFARHMSGDKHVDEVVARDDRRTERRRFDDDE